MPIRPICCAWFSRREREREPDACRVIEGIAGGLLLTANERELIRLIRIMAHGYDAAWLVMPDDTFKGVIPTCPSADLRFKIALDAVHEGRPEEMNPVAGGR